LVLNLNVVKTACLLIEVLEEISNRFNSLGVRSKQIRNKIIGIVEPYMGKVEQEGEMKYLLLEKDFELRDCLDLITRLQIVEFLESQYAENVVKEIWRGEYATQDSIFSSSTNHTLTWHWWTCIRDVEADQPFCHVKDITKIENHPMQFTVWRFSPKARVLIEWIVTLAFAIAVHFLIGDVMNAEPSLTENMTIYLGMKG
jgi:hypothetical protein